MSERDYSKPVAERLRAFGVEYARLEAERELLAFLREPETIDAIKWGHDYFYDLGESARAARFKALLSMLDALGGPHDRSSEGE